MRLIDYIHQGGAIMYALLLLNIVGIAIMFTKFFLFNRESKMVDETASKIANDIKGSLGSSDVYALIEVSKQSSSQYVGQIEKGLNTIKVIASISPLLGLLGTVLGVLVSFQVMGHSGLNDPGAFADAISMALITTVGGIVVAIPHFIGHSYLVGMLDRVEAQLEKRILSQVV